MPRVSEERGLQSVCPLIHTLNVLLAHLLAQKIMFGDWGLGSVSTGILSQA